MRPVISQVCNRRVIWLLSLCMFLEQFKPSEPHLVPYLIQEKGFTNDQLVLSIFPPSIYSTLVANLLAAPCVYQFGYKSVIIAGVAARLCTRLLLIYGTSLQAMQLAEVMFGFGEASQRVLESSVFMLVTEGDYQLATSASQAASLFAFVLSAELSQILLSYGASLHSLFCISLASVAAGGVVLFFYPWGSHKFATKEDVHSRSSSVTEMLAAARAAVWETYGHPRLRALSLWWVVGGGVYSMIGNYGTNLFASVDQSTDNNGHVEALARLASVAASLAASWLDRPLSQGGLLYITGSALVGIACLAMSAWRQLAAVYALYVVAMAVSQLLICLVFVQSARLLSTNQYALLFSLNSGGSVFFQCVVQYATVHLGFSVAQNFMAYGILSLALSSFCCMVFLEIVALHAPLPAHASGQDLEPTAAEESQLLRETSRTSSE